MSPEGGENPLAGAATLRGGILIAVAVVLGVVLLGKGFDTGFVGSSGGDPSDQAAGSGDDGTSDGDGSTDATTTTTAVVHTPAEVRVQVLNSTGPGGSAGAATSAVSAAGFTALGAANADDRTAPATVIYAAPGYEADAVAVGTALGVATAPVAMPTPPPPPTPADGTVHVVVVLGPDFVPPG